MLDYVREAIKKTVDDLKRYLAITQYAMQAITFVYLIYALIVGLGNVIVNAILLSLLVAYSIFDLITTKKGRKQTKNLRRKVGHVYAGIKIGVRTFTLGVTLYSIYYSASSVKPLSIILTTFMLLTWIIQVVLEIFKYLFESKSKLILAGWQKDMEELRKPITTAKEVASEIVRRVTRKERVEKPPIEKSKELLLLENRVEKKREKKRKEKEEIKARKKEDKKSKKSKAIEKDTQTEVKLIEMDDKIIDKKKEKKKKE